MGQYCVWSTVISEISVIQTILEQTGLTWVARRYESEGFFFFNISWIKDANDLKNAKTQF